MEGLKIYTENDVVELAEWFKQHEAEVPASMRINKYMNCADLRQTIKLLLEVAFEHWADTSFAGQIRCLEEIRDRIVANQA